MGRGTIDEPDGELVAFLRREHPRLVAALGSYLGDLMVAEELAQEALVRVAVRWRRVSRMRSPAGFAHRVALNLATSQLRRRAAEHRARTRLAGDALEAWRDPDTAAAVDLRRGLAELPEGQRWALVLRYAGGLSVVEAAEALGISEQAVRARCSRGIAQLRSRLAAEELAGEAGGA
jgi:RNA polymerase sigma factor (sigma-70 family)